MRKVMTIATVVGTCAALSLTTPTLGQDEATNNKNERGYSIESSQEGKGDRPISIGWIGLIGLAGLLGLGLPKFGKKRNNGSANQSR